MTTGHRRYWLRDRGGDIQAAPAIAAERWPGERPAELLLRLIHRGHQEILRRERPENPPTP